MSRRDRCFLWGWREEGNGKNHREFAGADTVGTWLSWCKWCIKRLSDKLKAKGVRLAASGEQRLNTGGIHMGD